MTDIALTNLEDTVTTLREELGATRTPTRRGRPSHFSEKERQERARKAAKAQQLAQGVLRARHKAEYDDLYEQAKKEVGL